MNVTQNKKEDVLFVRISKTEKDELFDIANQLDRPFSQIAREAIRKEVAELQTTVADKAEANG